MKKRLAAAALLISAALTLSGCFPTGEKDPNTSTDLSDSKSFEYGKDNFTASFELPDIPDNLPTRIKLKEKTFDAENMMPLFLSGKTVLDEKTWEGNYWTDDGSLLYVSSNSAGFSDGATCALKEYKIDAPLNYQAVVTVIEEYYRDTFDIGRELEEFSSQSAIDRALEVVSTLGITVLEKPEIYAFSLNSLEKLKERDLDFAFNEKYPITKDNEVYVLSFRRLFEGIELADADISIKDNTDETGSFSVDASNVTVGVSKDKIFYFSANEVYEEEYEIISSAPAKYDLNYALSELTSYLDKAYFSSETVIEKAKLVYFPVERNEPGYIEYALAWSFEGSAAVRGSGAYSNSYRRDDYKIFFLAETGVRIDYKR